MHFACLFPIFIGLSYKTISTQAGFYNIKSYFNIENEEATVTLGFIGQGQRVKHEGFWDMRVLCTIVNKDGHH